MIMLPWRASGVRSKMSLSITVATRRENKLSGRSPSTLRYSTIGKDGKHGWGTYPRLSMSGNFMQGRLQHEECFVSTIDIRGHYSDLLQDVTRNKFFPKSRQPKRNRLNETWKNLDRSFSGEPLDEGLAT